jgi:hypothetical protein
VYWWEAHHGRKYKSYVDENFICVKTNKNNNNKKQQYKCSSGEWGNNNNNNNNNTLLTECRLACI